MKTCLIPLAGLVLAIAGCAPMGISPAPAAVVDPEPVGAYLDPETLERMGAATPAPPAAGSPQDQADHAASTALIGYEDTPRWTLAQVHSEISPALAVAHFDCPLGTRLSQEPPPGLVRLLSRTLEDISTAARVAKARVFRARPFVDDPSRRTCIRVDDSYRTNSSAPSSHATAGIVYGRVMAQVAPDVADEMNRRGREIGVSRSICGLHYPADVEAGQALGEALFEAIARTPEYQADLAIARAEVAEARTLGRTNPACAAERLALGS